MLVVCIFVLWFLVDVFETVFWVHGFFGWCSLFGWPMSYVFLLFGCFIFFLPFFPGLPQGLANGVWPSNHQGQQVLFIPCTSKVFIPKTKNNFSESSLGHPMACFSVFDIFFASTTVFRSMIHRSTRTLKISKVSPQVPKSRAPSVCVLTSNVSL